MRFAALAALGPLLLASSACYTNAEPAAGPNPGQWQSGAVQPAYGQPGFGQPQPGYAPQQQAPGQWSPGQAAPNFGTPAASPFAWAFPFPIVQPPPFRPIDVNGLRALVGRVPCAPQETAAGEWVVFDCGLFSPVTRAVGLTFAEVDAYNSTRMGLTAGGSPTAALPASVDHRADGTEGPVKDQKVVGACTAFSLSTAMDHAVRKSSRQDVLSPLHVWSKYGSANMGTAGDSTLDKTITLEPIWPYDPVKACKLAKNPTEHCAVAYHVAPGSAALDPELHADQMRADAAGRYRLAAVEKLSSPANPDQIAAVLAGGDDVWTSFNVNTEVWAHLRGGQIPDYVSNDTTGHAVVLAGYRNVNGQRQFLIHNSWGTRWGDNGYAWISEHMVRTQMRGAYKVRIADVASKSLPGQVPAQETCAKGHVKDSVTGNCAEQCSSGSAPAAGVCLPTLPGLPSILGPSTQGSQNPCAKGQSPDLMTGSCMQTCATGSPTVGGMCLPLQR